MRASNLATNAANASAANDGSQQSVAKVAIGDGPKQ